MITRLDGADQPTFKVLGHGYALDINRIYFNGSNPTDNDGPYFYEVIPNADSRTFRLTPDSSIIAAQDAFRSYFAGMAQR